MLKILQVIFLIGYFLYYSDLLFRVIFFNNIIRWNLHHLIVSIFYMLFIHISFILYSRPLDVVSLSNRNNLYFFIIAIIYSDSNTFLFFMIKEKYDFLIIVVFYVNIYVRYNRFYAIGFLIKKPLFCGRIFFIFFCKRVNQYGIKKLVRVRILFEVERVYL